MPITRRQFFARLKKLGYSKSRLQMSRMGLTYEKDDDTGERITVTVPKHHEGTFHILGNVSYSGIFVQKIPGRDVNWGIPVDTQMLGMGMLEVCLGLCSGQIQVSQEPIEGESAV